MPEVPSERGRDFFGSLDESRQTLFRALADRMLAGQMLGTQDIADIIRGVDYPTSDAGSASSKVLTSYKSRRVLEELGVDVRLGLNDGKRAYYNGAQPGAQATKQPAHEAGMPEDIPALEAS
ncbi:MAG TPA: hypothetical protein VFH39_04975 [Candidatus Saccharimonadales bacterium]|nr:hypothetical protein [Candidatus Saccharimonadales bacterium]